MRGMCSKTLSMAWVIGTFRAHAILRNVLDDLDDSSGVYAIGKPPFDAKMD